MPPVSVGSAEVVADGVLGADLVADGVGVLDGSSVAVSVGVYEGVYDGV